MPMRSWSLEEFIEKARQIHGDKYQYHLVEMKTNGTKVVVVCPLPGHGPFVQEPRKHITRKQGCPKCGKTAPKDESDYIALAKQRGNVIYLGPFPPNTESETGWRCKVCDYSWKNTYHNIRKSEGCPRCSNHLQKTPEDYEELAKKRGDIEWLGPWVERNNIPTKWRCLVCKLEWFNCYGNIQQGQGCPECAKKRVADFHRYGLDEYKNLAQKNGFTFLAKKAPPRTSTLVRWKCNTCGSQFEMRYNDIQQGQGCPKCAIERQIERQKTKPEGYRALADELLGFEWLGPEVKNVKQKTWWKCDKRHRFYTSYDNLKANRNCPKCTQSKGEQEVDRVLRKLGVNYQAEKRFDECKDKRSLPFDFCVDIGGNRILIEVDGPLHFTIARFFSPDKAIQKLKDTQRRDAIKDRFAQEKGYHLLRIPYWRFKETEAILTEELGKYKEGVLDPLLTHTRYKQLSLF